MKTIAFLPLFLLLFFLCTAQQYSYTNYTTKDGLAGNTVYSICQDKEGFMWFGTEAGASRFDGTNFKNFTVAEGLPDNEIIYTYCDSKGRVWMAPFKKSICYYYRGKIFNEENDPVLRQLNLGSIVLQICGDEYGNVMFMSKFEANIISIENKVRKIKADPANNFTVFNTIGISRQNTFLIGTPTQLLEYNLNEKKLQNYNVSQFDFIGYKYKYILHKDFFLLSEGKELKGVSFHHNTGVVLPLTYDFLTFTYLNDSIFTRNTKNGSVFYNTRTGRKMQHFLPGIAITCVIKDSENNTWFSSKGNGVYRLNSETIRHLRVTDNKGTPLSALNSWYDSQQGLVVIHNNKYGSVVNAGGVISESFNTLLLPYSHTTNLVYLLFLENRKFFFATNESMGFFSRRAGSTDWHITGLACKDIFKAKNYNLYVATSLNALSFDLNKPNKFDTLLRERTTSIFFNRDTIYTCTLDGLVIIPRNRIPILVWKNVPILRNRVIKMDTTENGILWLATYNNGLIGYQHGKVVALINETNGLNSNSCRNLSARGNILWVATKKGICKVDASGKPQVLGTFDKGDGISAESVNAVCEFNGRVYIATDAGLDYFDEKSVSNTSVCNLRITGIVNAGSSMPVDTNSFSIPPHKNNISISYAGISFKSGGDITYHYTLRGLDTGWQVTRETKLNYPTLPAGDYELQLYAVNKFGLQSNTIKLEFSVEKKLWEKKWFIITAVLLLTGFVLLLTRWRVNIVQKREQEKAALVSTINELEQLALKSQMNPHFIFNSLNSIQQFVIDKNVEGANSFISSFSRLIRQTLDFSTRSEISIDEEIGYLSDYLSLEKNRLEDQFNYSVEIDPALKDAEVHIPPLLLQPYVENAVRHGVRNRSDLNGYIKIIFLKKENEMLCIIEDNGIGRKKAMELKKKNSIEYQSKGMALTARRIEILNKKSNYHIRVEIEDPETGNNQPAGTRVTVRFPVLN